MARTTESAVKAIVEVDEKNITDITPFIDTASALVDRVAACDATVTATTLELIERWLSAHFYLMRDPQRSEEKEDVVSAKYHGMTAMYLEATTYGQQAMMVDPTGCLSEINADAKGGKKKRIQLLHIRDAEVCP